MPKYTDARLCEWKEKGYMSFMKYSDFKVLYAQIPEYRDKHLLTYFFFTGARPGEMNLTQRRDIWLKDNKLTFRILTLKRQDKHIRLIDYTVDAYPELKLLWDWIKDLPHDFYVFSWLRIHTNPRQYIKFKLGISAYFFRHNLFSMLKMAGGTNAEIMLLKGSKDERSVMPYTHLGRIEREKLTALLDKALK